MFRISPVSSPFIAASLLASTTVSFAGRCFGDEENEMHISAPSSRVCDSLYAILYCTSPTELLICNNAALSIHTRLSSDRVLAPSSSSRDSRI